MRLKFLLYLEGRGVFRRNDVSGNPMSDRATINQTDMKSTLLHNQNDLTALHDSQRYEVIFFATAHLLFFNFLPTAQVAHFVLPHTHKPTQRQNKKSHFFQRLIGM